MDLEAAREEVVAEVLNAPKRRLDNEVSRLSDAVSVLQMHCKITDDLSQRYRKAWWRAQFQVAAAALVTVGIPASLLALGIHSIELIGGTVGLGSAATGGLYWWQSKSLEDQVCLYILCESSKTDRQLPAHAEAACTLSMRMHLLLI
jgi:hypothetical protein